MNLEKVTQQLKSEAAAHPVKAGALGLACVVAIWFWLPLIGKMFGGEESSRPVAKKPASTIAVRKQKAKVATANSFGGTVATAPVSPSGAKVSWPKLQDWMTADLRMKSAEKLANEHDPFQAVVREAPALADKGVPGEEKLPSITRPRVTAESVGLELTSTLVGQQRSVAMINGKSYRLTRTDSGLECEPAFIKLEGGNERLNVKLAAVFAKSVILEVDGQRLRLKLSESDSGNAGTFTAISPR